MLEDLRARLQLDKPLAYALMTRVWQAASGPITILLLIGSLDLAEQGVYYGIIGIVGIQAYFELGLLSVLVSQAGHETAAMNKVTASSGEGALQESDPEWLAAAARMRDLIRDSFRWFSGASLVYVMAALAFGWYSLAHSEVAWHGPLLALVPIAAISVCLSPGLSILEGAGFRDVIFRKKKTLSNIYSTYKYQTSSSRVHSLSIMFTRLSLVPSMLTTIYFNVNELLPEFRRNSPDIAV